MTQRQHGKTAHFGTYTFNPTPELDPKRVNRLQFEIRKMGTTIKLWNKIIRIQAMQALGDDALYTILLNSQPDLESQYTCASLIKIARSALEKWLYENQARLAVVELAEPNALDRLGDLEI